MDVLLAAVLTFLSHVLLRIAFSPFRLLYRVFTAAARAVMQALRKIGRTIKATPGAIWRVPIRAFKRVVAFRNWLLGKVELLQTESQKWKTTFNILKSPYSLLRSLGLNPQMAASLLIGTSVVGGGVVVNETILAEPSFASGDSGIYSAPSDVPTFFSEEYNTLRVDLGTTPVQSLIIEDVSVGTAYTGSQLPSNSTQTLDVGGDHAVGTWLHVGELIYEKNRCETLTLADISTHNLNVINMASDGQSLSASAGSARNRSILGGHNMASSMHTQGGLYDRIWINAPTSGVNGQIDRLVLRNIFSRTGACKISRVKAGTVTLRLSETGGDSDLATKAFVIAPSVTAQNITYTSNVEMHLPLPATQTMDN